MVAATEAVCTKSDVFVFCFCFVWQVIGLVNDEQRMVELEAIIQDLMDADSDCKYC